MKKREALTAAFWVLLGIVVSLWSSTYPFGTLEVVGPALLPFLCGLILILLGSFLFFQTWRRHEGESRGVQIYLVPKAAALRRVAITTGGMLLSALLIDFLGFIITVFSLSFFLLRGIQPQKLRYDIFYALIVSLSCYVLFRVLIKTTLPKGFLGF